MTSQILWTTVIAAVAAVTTTTRNKKTQETDILFQLLFQHQTSVTLLGADFVS